MSKRLKPQDRTALLRQGVSVLDARRGRIAVAGVQEEETREIVAHRLGADTRIDFHPRAARRHRPLPCVGHMEREEKRLQLRFVLRGDDHVADIEVEEDGDSVVVFATVCSTVDEATNNEWEVPCHVYLEEPLGLRDVFDGVTGLHVPFKNVWAEMGAE
jgi:hypothetical protein